MAERTIILSAEQVRALRAGETRVRVPVSGHVLRDWAACGKYIGAAGPEVHCADGIWRTFAELCPYAPGDVLRVREPWRAKSWTTNAKFNVCIEYAAGGEQECSHDDVERFLDSCLREWETSSPDSEVLRWRSAATMPAWAARMWLTVERVQAERDGDGWAWVLTVREGKS